MICFRLTQEVLAWTLQDFFQKAAGFLSRPPAFLPAEALNIDELAFLLVAAGLWRQHELWDGTYTLDDLLDVVELLQVMAENQRRATE